MKNKRKNILNLMIAGLAIVGFSNNTIKNNVEIIEDSCIINKRPDNDVCVKPKVKLNPLFDYTYNRFKVYNRDIDSNTVSLFIDVAEHYNFTKDSTQFRLVVGQILVESGANQYYFKGHPYEGELVLSPVGAVGITQVMPTTAKYFLEKILSENDIKVFKKFGATDFSFVENKNLSYDNKVDLSRKWLMNKDNNIIMWGYIMRYNMSKTGNNIIKSLIAYNAGRGGLNNFIKKGNSIWKHKYVTDIYNRLARVERKIA